jgi:signal transduction histidine kinase
VQNIVPAEAAACLLDPAGVGALRAPLRTRDGKGPMIEWTSCHAPAGDALLLITGRDVSRETSLEDYITANQWFELAAALSGGLAHDFNNALAAILGLSELISLRLPPDSPLQDFSAKIARSVDRAKVLVRRFSQFSRKSPGLVEAQPTAMLLGDMGTLLVGFLPGNVTFEISTCAETPWCRADRHALEQIVLNCVNFLRGRLRAETGRIVLASRASADGSHALIELTGSGQGLVGVDVEAIFNLDLRPTASAYESGAGLFTARLIASRHETRLHARRDDPRTVTFVIEVPAASAEC